LEEAARELLGDGARAAHDLALARIDHESVGHRQEVHPDVAHESAVLGGDHRRHDGRGNAMQRRPRIPRSHHDPA
jgi:hypothetical protein